MKPLSPLSSVARPATRDPERTKERILKAAFREFATNGFAGARVDAVARGAAINKRMLYHYFGDKQGLFREVLRRKIAERQAWMVATPDDPGESLPFWFDKSSRDVEWIRLLEWEALQFVEKGLIDEQKRREAAKRAVGRIRKRQEQGHLSNHFDAKYLLLAMMALTWFPLAFPQLARLVTGQAVSSRHFLKEQKNFLREFAAAFRGGAPGEHLGTTALIALRTNSEP